MKIFNSLNEFKSIKKTIVTLGTFDGVHIGHNAILNRLNYIAQKENLESVILTFFPHPRLVVSNENEIKLLNTMLEKSNLLAKKNIQNFIIHPFNKEFSELSPKQFVEEILVNKLNIQKIIIGYDHKFGKNRTADFNDLIILGNEFGFEVEEISAQQINDVSVSSTKIRNALIEGNIELANKYLGYNYHLNGIVVKGSQLGRTIGFPTANIFIKEEYKLIPKNGVYAVSVYVNGKEFNGIINIGVKPTLGENQQTIEVYILDFSKDIYNEKIKVNFLKRLRDEQKFENFEDLKIQIEKDKINSIQFFENNK